MSPTSVTTSWRVRTNSQTQLYYPMGFHYSAVFNAQWSHVTDKCNIMSPLDPVQHRVTSFPRWILSNTDGWIMRMVEPESTSAIIGIPFASILWYNFPDNLYSKLSLVQMTLSHDQPQNPGFPYAAEFTELGTRHSHSRRWACPSNFQVRRSWLSCV